MNTPLPLPLQSTAKYLSVPARVVTLEGAGLSGAAEIQKIHIILLKI
jgi:hypothetical protein